MKDDGDLTRILKKTSILIGVAILLISIYLSFDGFDGAVNGVNSEYDLFAIIIGIVFAAAVTILQFIFTSSYKDLNATLKVIGLLSYAYSIYTNKLGAVNILHMDENMAWIVAVFADIVAEPMIAWGLGEALVGDLLGNLGKSIYGKPQTKTGVQPVKPVGFQGNRPSFRPPQSKPKFQHKGEEPSFRKFFKDEEE